MSKIKSFPSLIEKVNFNYIKLILVFLLLKISPCFATNNLIININDTKIILKGNFVQGGLVKGKINKDLKIKLLDIYPAFSNLNSLAIALNEAYAQDTQEIKEKDEIVLIPPVSGG